METKRDRQTIGEKIKLANKQVQLFDFSEFENPYISKMILEKISLPTDLIKSIILKSVYSDLTTKLVNSMIEFVISSEKSLDDAILVAFDPNGNFLKDFESLHNKNYTWCQPSSLEAINFIKNLFGYEEQHTVFHTLDTWRYQNRFRNYRCNVLSIILSPERPWNWSQLSLNPNITFDIVRDMNLDWYTQQIQPQPETYVDLT
jgi:hypothetical protein